MPNSDTFDLDDFLPYLLNQAASETSLEFQKYYKGKYGLLQTEWRVIFHLGRNGTMTATDICTRARIHKTKVSRAVSGLERRRYLSRRAVPNDRRHEGLTLTRQGEVVYADLREAAFRFDRAVMAQIPRQN
ncbi:MAG: MarR family transcriptional regulator, partial [Pseudomonadota bacterium]